MKTIYFAQCLVCDIHVENESEDKIEVEVDMHNLNTGHSIQYGTVKEEKTESGITRRIPKIKGTRS